MTVSNIDDRPCLENAEAIECVLQAISQYEGDGTLSEKEILLLKNVIGSYQIKNLMNMYDKLKSVRGQTGYRGDYIRLCIEIMVFLENDDDKRCKELFNILNDPFFRCLIDAHDKIAHETYKVDQTYLPIENLSKADEFGTPIRVVGLTKLSNEPLGVALGKHLDNCVYIKRILPGTMVEKQGLLAVGDIIRELNGEKVTGDLASMEEKMQGLQGDITIKVIPAFRDMQGNCHVFLKCHFDYNPTSDDQFPKSEVGLLFKKGDIIEVNDKSDSKWWQASQIFESGKSGLIPSLKYEQMRRNFTSSLKSFKGKKKVSYRTSEHALFDCLDMTLYEEVTRMPVMERKVIVLIGAAGIGRRTLKRRLIENYPTQYTTILADTSRPPRDKEISGRGYHFIQKERMIEDIAKGLYLEWGEYNGNYYGTRLDAIRDVMNAGKICVIDCNPSALKILKTAEFMPLIIFIDSPNINQLEVLNKKRDSTKTRIHQQLEATLTDSEVMRNQYHHYFDLQVVNDDYDKTYNQLKEFIQQCLSEPQWVPVSWVY